MFNPAGAIIPYLRYILCSTECSCIGAQNFVRKKRKDENRAASSFLTYGDQRREEGRAKKMRKRSRSHETRDLGLYVRTYVCLSGRVFVSVCIAVPSTKRTVQEHAEVHEHVLHGDVHCRVHTEDRSIRREGRLHIPPNIPLSSSSQYIF